MKRIIPYFLGISLIAITFTSCKSAKGGCGLTSDAQKIEQTTAATNSIIVVDV